MCNLWQCIRPETGLTECKWRRYVNFLFHGRETKYVGSSICVYVICSNCIHVRKADRVSLILNTRGPLVLYRSPVCWGYVKISGYWGKRSLKILNLSDLEQGQWMSLTFGIHVQSCMYSFSFLHLPIVISQITIISEKYIILLFSHTKQNQSWSCRKMCHVKVTPGSSFEQTL